MKDRNYELPEFLHSERKIYIPRWYQEDCLNRLEKTRSQGNDKALVVMATGLGKTSLAAFDTQRVFRNHQNPKALFMCHQSEILNHARRTFEAILGDEYRYGFYHGKIKDDPNDTNFLFATYQTLGKNLDRFPTNFFDYVIADESHHSQAETFKPVINYFSPNFALGITATPDRSDLLDIRKIFGREVFSLGLEKALALNILAKVDYRVMYADVNPQKLKEIENLEKSKLSLALLDRELFQPQPLEEVIRTINEKKNEIENPKIMVFTPNTDVANEISSMMENASPLHSKMTDSEQTRVFSAFNNGNLETVSVVDKFNEGVDVPEANIIVFLRSTSSKTIFLQQLGRGLRKTDNKKSVMVLDFVGNCERIQMVNELWTGVNREIDDLENIEGPTRKRSLSVDVGTLSFSETSINIVDVIKNVSQGITKELIIKDLQNIAKRIKRTPTKADVNNFSRIASSTTVENYFGTHNKALKEAHLEPVWSVTRRTNQEMIDDLLTLKDELGEIPLRTDVRTASKLGKCAGYTTYCDRFGDYYEALNKAGLFQTREEYERYIQMNKDISSPIKTSSYSTEELITLMTEYISNNGVPTARDLRTLAKTGKMPSDSVYSNRFGSFVDAVNIGLAKLGMDLLEKPAPQKKWEEEEIFDGLRKLHSQLGRLPKAHDINVSNKEGLLPTSKSLEKRYGTVKKALIAAGLTNK